MVPELAEGDDIEEVDEGTTLVLLVSLVLLVELVLFQ